jgi:hypothetical protein
VPCLSPITRLLPRSAGGDAYDVVFGTVGVAAALLLTVRLLLTPAGDRHVRGHRTNELLLILALLGLAVLLLHQLITDDLCHGSCPLALAGPGS